MKHSSAFRNVNILLLHLDIYVMICLLLKKTHLFTKHKQAELQCLYLFTTHSPTVTDVLVSGRNVGALRPGRRVPFRSLAPGLADDISRGHIIFVTPTALKLLQLGPNSKRGKLSGDHCRFFKCI